jgi:multidrug transporter EmrE-like cation transporter
MRTQGVKMGLYRLGLVALAIGLPMLALYLYEQDKQIVQWVSIVAVVCAVAGLRWVVAGFRQ